MTGAGRGLGRLYAKELAARGAAVVVNDLGGSMGGEGADSGVADEVVREIEQAGGRAVSSYDSVTSPEGGAAIVRAAMDTFGRLDAVVSNAGIFNSIAFEDMTPTDWRRMLEVHLDGGFHLSHAAYPVMKEQRYTETIRDPKALADLGFRKVIDPEPVVPMVVFLAGRDCESPHHNYSACAGRFARVFVGLGEGWLADPETRPTADDIAAHLPQIAATEPFTVPGSIFEEVFGICERLGVNPLR